MKLQSQLSFPKPIISTYKIIGVFFGPIHSVFHHCGSLYLQTSTQNVIFVFIYLFIHFCQLNIIADKMNKPCDSYTLYSYNFIKRTCSACVDFHEYLSIVSLIYVKKVIFCYCCFGKLCFIDRKAYFKRQFGFFGTSQCSICHICLSLTLILSKIMCISCI